MSTVPTELIEKPAHVGSWPFALDEFDRAPELTPIEIGALSAWHAHWKTPNTHSLQAAERLLTRLTQPLDKVFTYYGNDLRTKRSARSFLLNEMHKRQTSIWAWGEQEWLECIGRNYDDFRAYHVHRSKNVRNYVMACAYLLSNAPIIRSVTDYQQKVFACRIFGSKVLFFALNIVAAEMGRLGYQKSVVVSYVFVLLSEALLINRSPELSKLSPDAMQELTLKYAAQRNRKRLQCCGSLSVALYNLRIIPAIIKVRTFNIPKNQIGVDDSVPEEWLAWINRWRRYATPAAVTRDAGWRSLAKVGRWLYATHKLTNPTEWTRDTCLSFVADVNNMVVGDWVHPLSRMENRKLGKPSSPNSKANIIGDLRTFFMNCQEWEWLPATFAPARYLATPRSVQSLRQPNPRVIQEDIWLKLLSAGMKLQSSDLPDPSHTLRGKFQARKGPYYPLELVRAIVLVWLFAGLRSDEIHRLRLGCIRWGRPEGGELKEGDSGEHEFTEDSKRKRICLLNVPINKTSHEFTKPVDYVVGEVIEMWEKLRPWSRTHWDTKTGEEVDFLFVWRGKQVGKNYVNETVIPMLCEKAGVPTKDARGNITSHRARSTVATQLLNAPEPMNLVEIMHWLGHKSLKSTEHYARMNPTKIASVYKDAGIFSRNMKLVNVLIDKERARDGADSKDETTLYYDLIHGYCTYDYFAKCPHRMACVKCPFYLPKKSEQAKFVEAKSNILRMQQFIPLTDLEILAVEEDTSALAKLAQQLEDFPTPQGATPREMRAKDEDLIQE